MAVEPKYKEWKEKKYIGGDKIIIQPRATKVPPTRKKARRIISNILLYGLYYLCSEHCIKIDVLLQIYVEWVHAYWIWFIMVGGFIKSKHTFGKWYTFLDNSIRCGIFQEVTRIKNLRQIKN